MKCQNCKKKILKSDIAKEIGSHKTKKKSKSSAANLNKWRESQRVKLTQALQELKDTLKKEGHHVER